MITKEDAMNAKHGDIFYHISRENRTGAVRVRVSGKCKTWKTRPLEYRLPVKYGLYSSFYIDHNNAHEWRKEES